MTSGTSSTESLYNDRFSGLMSGIDTESIVKAMASGTKTKINKQKHPRPPTKLTGSAMGWIPGLPQAMQNTKVMAQ